jgi:hypothetical protein
MRVLAASYLIRTASERDSLPIVYAAAANDGALTG